MSEEIRAFEEWIESKKGGQTMSEENKLQSSPGALEYQCRHLLARFDSVEQIKELAIKYATVADELIKENAKLQLMQPPPVITITLDNELRKRVEELEAALCSARAFICKGKDRTAPTTYNQLTAYTPARVIATDSAEKKAGE